MPACDQLVQGSTATWSARGSAGRAQIGESGASPTQAEICRSAASRRNGRFVELETLAIGWRAARFGKNLVRRVAVRPQCGCHQSHEIIDVTGLFNNDLNATPTSAQCHAHGRR